MKLKSYPEYCDPERSFLPVLPAHWHVQRNKHLLEPCKSTVGKNASNYQLLSLTLKGIIKRDIETGFGKMPAEFDSYQVVEKGDIIFCLFDMDETPRTVGLSDQDGMITGAYSVFRPKPNMTPEYIYYYYLHLDSFKGLRPFYTGLRKVIRSEVFASIETPVPPEEEQTQIASFLDRETAKIDRLIEKQQRLIELLEEKRQAVISHSVTKGLNPNVPMKDSGLEWLGEVPEHWCVKRLKTQCEIFGRIGFRGYTTSDIVSEGEGALTLNPSNILNGKITLKNCTYITWQKYHESPEIQVADKDILIVKTGSTYGKAGHIEECNEPMTINPQMALLKNAKCNSEFLYYSLSSTYTQSTIFSKNTGSGMPTITQETIGNLSIPLPSHDEQIQITTYLNSKLDKIAQLIMNCKKSIVLSNERRTALISAAVTGKIDVRNQVPQDVEEAVAS